jgi:acid stress-induced BolA-like protein IbaG/YrbA
MLQLLQLAGWLQRHIQLVIQPLMHVFAAVHACVLDAYTSSSWPAAWGSSLQMHI